ncbi:ankyrin repeat protein, partial [Ancylostoma ceylanicum]
MRFAVYTLFKIPISSSDKHAVELLWTANNEGKTPLRLDKWLLHEAAGKGYLEVVKRLIQNGYNVRLRDSDEKLPLHAAAMSKRSDVVQYLLELAPDCIDERDGYGMSAFHCAVSMDALDTVKVGTMLVKNNTNIFATDFDGRTAVFIGAKFNAINVLT